MKKKRFLCLLVLCTVFAAGCGEAQSTGEADTVSEEQGDTLTDASSDGGVRLVSVENVADYITLAEYRGIVLQKSAAAVTDEDVENGISEALKDSMETVSGKNTTVQEGDSVTVSYVGRLNGRAFDGGTGEMQDLVVGSGTMLPGFEDGIIGMKTGETKKVDVTFPEDYSAAGLAGQSAVFEITLRSFKRVPELTDEWVTENTDYAGVEEYRAGMRAKLEQEAEDSLEAKAWSAVFDSSEVVEYPQEDLDEASASFKSQIEAYAGEADMTLEDYVESQGMSADDFEALCLQYAREKVKQNLVVQGIMDAEGMTLEDEESLAIQAQLVSDYGAGDLAALVDSCGQQAVDESIGLLRVQAFILANANIEQEAQETAAPAEAADADETQTAQAEGETAQAETEAAQAEAETAQAETEAAQAETEAAQAEAETAQPETVITETAAQ